MDTESAPNPPVIAVAGLAFEADIARAPGVEVAFGQNRPRLIERIEGLAKRGARGIISFGTAGGLAPDLTPGAILVASAVLTGAENFQTDASWTSAILAALPGAQAANLIGVDAPVTAVEEKSRLWLETGAAAADMESHVAAKIAARFGLRFAALRVVVDPPCRALPSAALAAMRDDGRTDVSAVILALARRPGELPALIRLAGDVRKARASLFRSREALGLFFGLDSGELALDVK